MSNRYNDQLADLAIDTVDSELERQNKKVSKKVRELMYRKEYTKLMEKLE